MIMTPQQLYPVKTRISEALACNRVNSALSELESMAAAVSAPWPIKDKIEKLKEHYKLLLQYALDGIMDSGRVAVRDEIMSGIATTADMIIREATIKDSSKLYFSVLRYENMQADSSVSQLAAIYREKNSRYNMGIMTGNHDIKEADGTLLAIALESLATRLFNVIWTKHPFESSDNDAVLSIMENDTLPLHMKVLMLNAVLLGALEYYDEHRLFTLAEIYRRQLPQLEVRALCAMLMVMWMQREYTHTRKFSDVIAALSDMPRWREDVKMAFLQLVRTRDTERINRTMREDVIPSMMKLRPEINKIIKDESDIVDSVSMEANPEWEELFEKSGLGDKLREISEMQADGADVMMSTFSHLKTFPFFSDVAHWFLPFYPEESHVRAVLGSDSLELGELLAATPMLCDSDKYSMVLSLERIAGVARRLMMEQIKAQGINMAELRNSSLLPEATERENAANKYVQDLYRFFSLFRRKNEFENPFGSPVNLVELPELASVFDDTDTITVVAQFYFKRGYYAEALSLYKILMNRAGADAQLCQKAGYCLQQSGDIRGAIEMYEQSELYNSDSAWTMRRLAVCYRLEGDSAKAAAYYARLMEKKPEDLTLALHLGACLLDLKKYDEALKQYFKVEFLDSSSTRALRPIAWCLFLTGQLERSRGYYEKIMTDAPTANDCLNYGHLFMAQGRYRDALAQYKDSLRLCGGDVTKWTRMFTADIPVLEDAAVDSFMISLVADEVTAV